jgi:Ni,Fe-hydrogenase III large subunit/Ni,Fe-hydrogenase III component G
MQTKSFIDELNMNFKNDIYKSTVMNCNELYVSINPENVLGICKYVCQKLGGTLVSMFANDERAINGHFAIYYVFAIRAHGLFIILNTCIDPNNPTFHSIANEIHAAHLYEREIQDTFGLKAKDHPYPERMVFHDNWPENTYPLRKEFNGRQKPPIADVKNKFVEVEGTGVFEIPVGPVHAGIIEPGHFRFSVAGEPIINLEAQLYFVHKGIEKLSEGAHFEKCFYISERISGDETFSNSLAYCQAIEKIAGVDVPVRAKYLRVMFAELERLASHIGDLGGVCIDVAYGFAAYQFKMLRIWTYQIIEEVCGSRFLRSVNTPGGVRKDFLEGKENRVLEFMSRIKNELKDTEKIIFSNSLFIDRVENTGIVPNSVARDLNAVGPGGRAAGIQTDLRKEFAYSAYEKFKFNVPDHHNGDVNCRVHVKLEECYESIGIITQVIQSISKGKVSLPITRLEPYKCALGYSESPKGENIHWVMTGENNTIYRYKIRTPSFCNWPVLCYAVRGNIVPDFPLINKSFNLSYAGNDL